jgi:hypothetical protein
LACVAWQVAQVLLVVPSCGSWQLAQAWCPRGALLASVVWQVTHAPVSFGVCALAWQLLQVA